MSDVGWDLLEAPVFRMRGADGAERRGSLADVFATLSGGAAVEFPGLQAHHEHAWHAFLVQTAVIVLSHYDNQELRTEATWWRDELRKVARSRQAWALVVSDLSMPAFFQPPVPEGSLDSFERAPYADDLDLLVTSKNHDVKRSRLLRADPEAWAYLLVSVQTMSGYSGRGNYGIARMNGGLGSRPCVAYAPGLGRAERFQRDVQVCLASRQALLEGEFGYREDGVAFVWLEPWDGSSSLSLSTLDPFFVEACRRIRLTNHGDRLVAYRRRTDCARIAAKIANGVTGDPWTPVDRASGKALTISAAGFGYERLQDLLFPEQYTMGVAGTLSEQDGDQPWFLASVLVRGQGRTEGVHERELRVPARVRKLLRHASDRDRLRIRARRWVEKAKVAKTRVLRPALAVLLDDSKSTRGARNRFREQLDTEIDRIFFARLWETAEIDDNDAVDAEWAKHLVTLSRQQLAAAIASMPRRSAAYYKIIAEAECLLESCAHKQFPSAFPPREGR